MNCVFPYFKEEKYELRILFYLLIFVCLFFISFHLRSWHMHLLLCSTSRI